MPGYTSPYAPAERYQNQYAVTIADLMRRSSQARAESIQRQGQITGDAWRNVGNTAAATLGSILQQKQDAPIRAAQLQGLQQQNQIGALQIGAAERKAADDNAMDSAGQVPVNDRASFLAQVPGHLRADIEKKYAEVDKLAADANTAKQTAAEKEADYFGGLAASVKPYLTGPDGGMGAAQMALQHAQENGHDVSAITQRLQDGTLALPTLLDSLIQGSPTQRKLAGEEQDRALRGKAEDRAMASMQQTAADRAADNTRQDAAAAETARHNRASEAAAAATKNDVTDLSAAGLDMAALNYKKTGVMPALGNGDKTTRKRIIDRAATLTEADATRIESGGNSIASNKANYKADSGSLDNVTRTLDTLTAFESTAGKNLKQFTDLADKVPDTGVPWLNTPVRLLNDKLVGSGNQAAFQAARDVALREIARVTNDPKLSGVLSDSARQEVSGLSPKDATFAQIKAVAKVLQQDMANVHSSLDAQRTSIQGRIGGKAASGAVSVTAPNGKTYTFTSQADADAFKAKAGIQ